MESFARTYDHRHRCSSFCRTCCAGRVTRRADRVDAAEEELKVALRDLTESGQRLAAFIRRPPCRAPCAAGPVSTRPSSCSSASTTIRRRWRRRSSLRLARVEPRPLRDCSSRGLDEPSGGQPARSTAARSPRRGEGLQNSGSRTLAARPRSSSSSRKRQGATVSWRSRGRPRPDRGRRWEHRC